MNSWIPNEQKLSWIQSKAKVKLVHLEFRCKDLLLALLCSSTGDVQYHRQRPTAFNPLKRVHTWASHMSKWRIRSLYDVSVVFMTSPSLDDVSVTFRRIRHLKTDGVIQVDGLLLRLCCQLGGWSCNNLHAGRSGFSGCRTRIWIRSWIWIQTGPKGYWSYPTGISYGGSIWSSIDAWCPFYGQPLDQF